MRLETFKGLTEEQVKNLEYNEFLKLIDSRSRRTLNRLQKNPRLKDFMKKVDTLIKENKTKKPIKTHIREAIILPNWLGLTFAVHNGKEFKNIEITLNMIGRRLGEFAHSTSRVIHHGPGVGATRGSKFVPLK